ncbi:MAG: diguanylate cyclase [Sulfurimonas sp.]|nr:diguanylate cyclase [Sulfurimonas sp.]
MKFIEALKLRSKLLFLFILVIIGLVLVSIMGTINMNAMKKNIDSLYFGSLVPVTELNDILQIYNGDLPNIIYKAKSDDISSSQVSSQINNSIEIIEKKWKSYQGHFKRDEELQYVEYVLLEISSINEYFSKIAILSEKGIALKKISNDILEKKVSHIHTTIKKLIKYEVDIAKYERKKFLYSYNAIVKEVAFILLFIIVGILVISFYVFKSIQNDQTKLEITTKKLKRSNKKLENASYTDSLTSLHNRRYFNFIYDKELKRAKRDNKYITFMMLDIDFFKQYNDTYGHIEGDNALKNVAKVLKNSLKRPSDYVFRLGGEEFGVILSDTDEKNSSLIAQNICEHIRAQEISHKTSKVSEFLTISVGVACCIADESLDEEYLLTRADEMLYKSKESGRDKFLLTTDISKAKTKEVA